MDPEMMAALEADGEKLRQLTGEDHGPVFMEDDGCCGQYVWGAPFDAPEQGPMCGACPRRAQHKD